MLLTIDSVHMSDLSCSCLQAEQSISIYRKVIMIKNDEIKAFFLTSLFPLLKNNTQEFMENVIIPCIKNICSIYKTNNNNKCLTVRQKKLLLLLLEIFVGCFFRCRHIRFEMKFLLPLF